jgi:hypothetical protein
MEAARAERDLPHRRLRKVPAVYCQKLPSAAYEQLLAERGKEAALT